MAGGEVHRGEQDAGTSSRLHPLDRPKFGELLTYARPGDTVHISEMFRLVRGTRHIPDVLDVRAVLDAEGDLVAVELATLISRNSAS